MDFKKNIFKLLGYTQREIKKIVEKSVKEVSEKSYEDLVIQMKEIATEYITEFGIEILNIRVRIIPIKKEKIKDLEYISEGKVNVDATVRLLARTKNRSMKFSFNFDKQDVDYPETFYVSGLPLEVSGDSLERLIRTKQT